MITLSMAVEDKTLWDDVHSSLQSESVQIDCEESHVDDLGSFIAGLERANPDMVLLDVSVSRSPFEDAIRKIRLATPGAMIVALNTAETGPVLECFRAGVDEYLFPPLTEGLKKAIDHREAERIKSDSGKPEGKTLAFLSAKGGCGATTLACHVALELSRLNQSVLLADLDLNAGMVAFLTKAKSPYSIADASNNLHRLDASYWKALVSNSSPNLDVISAPTAMAAKQEPMPEKLRQVLKFARRQYRWTVADAGRGINQHTMTAVESADEACIVTTPE